MSVRFVLDTSVTLTWALKDENNLYADSVLDALLTMQAMVPVIWTLEVANVLLVSERRGRLTNAMTENFLGLLRKLPITVETTSAGAISDHLIDIGRTYSITSYDAGYLELGLRENLPIASLDARMQSVMATVGVPLFDPTLLSRS